MSAATWDPAAPGSVFHAVGAAFVVLGGVIAAVTGPLDLDKGSWLAAYLVLVCGVAQTVLGRAQESLPLRVVPARVWQGQFLGWNLGNALVVGGTLAGLPFVVDLGGLLLLGVIVLAVWVLRDGVARSWGWAYGALLLVVAVSVPIGIALSHLRS